MRGDMVDPESIKRAVAGTYGVYSVQSPQEGGPEREEAQGIMVANAAMEAGVSHLVYSSVAGAERRSGVPHFESKWRVEQHIASIGLPATVIRPVLFMDNFATFKFRLIMLAMSRTFVPDSQKKLRRSSSISADASPCFTLCQEGTTSSAMPTT